MRLSGRVALRTLRYTDRMSRLRRVQVTGTISAVRAPPHPALPRLRDRHPYSSKPGEGRSSSFLASDAVYLPTIWKGPLAAARSQCRRRTGHF